MRHGCCGMGSPGQTKAQAGLPSQTLSPFVSWIFSLNLQTFFSHEPDFKK